MKKRLIAISLFCCVMLLLAAGIFYIQDRKRYAQDIKSEQIVAVNEIEQLALEGDMHTLSERSRMLQDSLRFSEAGLDRNMKYFMLSGICVLYIFGVFAYVYLSVLKPFEMMKVFAKEIAQGNFDIPLEYERSNYFGDFTWAFDSMRGEITKARASEKEAVENNKTVIATLSHDIKTPIASIRAYAEGLEANMDSSVEKRARYLSVLMRKCDEVSRLTDDLFLHSLSDLDRLKISVEGLELCGFLQNMADEISAGHNDIELLLPQGDIAVLADRNRLMQVCENLINNARKYAKTKVLVSAWAEGDFAKVSFRDYGGGILDEDMPFIFGKFYRGKNCGQEQGSGLGLYIIKYITEKMGGGIFLQNHAKGLEAVVSIPRNCM